MHCVFVVVPGDTPVLYPTPVDVSELRVTDVCIPLFGNFETSPSFLICGSSFCFGIIFFLASLSSLYG